MDGDRAVAQVPRAGGVEERRQLGEPAAAPLGRDLRELVAEVVREARAYTFELQQPPLVLDAVRAPAADAGRADDAVDGQERRELAARAERAGGARRARPPGERGELAVGDDLSAGHGAQRAGAVPVEPVRKDERDVREVVGPPVEKRLQTDGRASEQRLSFALSRL